MYSEAISQRNFGHAEHPGMGTRRVRAILWAGGGAELSPESNLILGTCGKRGNFQSNSVFSSLQRGR